MLTPFHLKSYNASQDYIWKKNRNLCLAACARFVEIVCGIWFCNCFKSQDLKKTQKIKKRIWVLKCSKKVKKNGVNFLWTMKFLISPKSSNWVKFQFYAVFIIECFYFTLSFCWVSIYYFFFQNFRVWTILTSM